MRENLRELCLIQVFCLKIHSSILINKIHVMHSYLHLWQRKRKFRVPPRGQDGCQESQTAHRNLTASAPLSFACPPHQRCNQDTPQLQDTSVPSTPTTLPTALVTAQPNPIPPSGPLHSLLLPPGALSPNFRRDGSHHTGFTLSLCPSAASSETSSLPSKTLTPPSPLSFLSCHLSLSVAMVF